MLLYVSVFIVVVVLALAFPQYGAWARWRKSRELGERSQREDLLKHMLKCEANARLASLESIAGALQIRPGHAAVLVDRLEDLGLVRFEDSALKLMPDGREMALHIVRAHRLWESYLAEKTGVSERRWHEEAERREHLLSPKEADALAAQLGNPTHDPHGDVIPRPHGTLSAERGQPLHSVPENTPVLITHVEDEPETIYAQLCAEGLRAGMRAYVMEKSAHRIRFWADGTEHVLAPVLANNITVAPLPHYKVENLVEQQYLSGLRQGQGAKVAGLSRACRGAERRRLLDLGFVPGTAVLMEMRSPSGDPTAYRVRGALVALRKEQANLIQVQAGDPNEN